MVEMADLCSKVVGLFTFVIIILKIAGVVHWPWLWITAPIWGGLSIAITALIILGAIAMCEK